jgi:hypothetical protein
MEKKTRIAAKFITPLLDIFLAIPLFVATLIMKLVRRLGIWRMPISKSIFNFLGVYPIRDHYYEPLFNHKKHLVNSLRLERSLPGININESVQLKWLDQFNYMSELTQIPLTAPANSTYFYRNPNFSEGDAECLYSMIRLKKPNIIIEIGSGFSTMMARLAIAQNKKDNLHYSCRHICIEPFEMKWLDNTVDIEVLRKRLENVDLTIFSILKENDILFIDSSHIIRPQGDVLTECLQILPLLNPGVLIHFHDIFTPYDYLNHWLLDEVKFWNEQYLLEAFLSCNKNFEIVLALNFLNKKFRNKMVAKFPMLMQQEENNEPKSFWIRKIN